MMPTLFPRPCTNCGRLSRNGSRCKKCEDPRPHYKGDWPKIAAAAIAAHPYCSNCGSTEDLTADHVEPRSLRKGVRVLCRRCNSSKGGRRV